MRMLLAFISIFAFKNVFGDDPIVSMSIRSQTEERRESVSQNSSGSTVVIHKGSLPWQPLAKAKTYGLKVDNGGEGDGGAESPKAQQGANEGAATSIDEAPDVLERRQQQQQHKEEDEEKDLRADLHESLRQPLRRLSDRQLALLLKQIRRQRRRQMSTEVEDIGKIGEEADRRETLRELQELLRSTESGRRLLRPKLLTNINILPNEWAIYPPPRRNGAAQEARIAAILERERNRGSDGNGTAGEQLAEGKEGLGGEERRHSLAVHTVELGRQEANDGTAAETTTASGVHSVALAPLDTFEGEFATTERIEENEKQQKEEQSLQLHTIEIGAAVANGAAAEQVLANAAINGSDQLGAAEVLVAEQRQNNGTEQERIETLANGWRLIEQEFEEEMRSAVQNASELVAKMATKLEETRSANLTSEEQLKHKAAESILFSSKTLQAGPNAEIGEHQQKATNAREGQQTDGEEPNPEGGELAERERAQLNELSEALREIRLRYETLKRQFLNKMRDLGQKSNVGGRFPGPIKAAGTPVFVNGKIVAGKREGSVEVLARREQNATKSERWQIAEGLRESEKRQKSEGGRTVEVEEENTNTTIVATIPPSTTTTTTTAAETTIKTTTSILTTTTTDTTTTQTAEPSSSSTTTTPSSTTTSSTPDTTTPNGTSAPNTNISDEVNQQAILVNGTSSLARNSTQDDGILVEKENEKSQLSKQRQQSKLTLAELAKELEEIERAIANRRSGNGTGALEAEKKAKKILRANKQLQRPNKARLSSDDFAHSASFSHFNSIVNVSNTSTFLVQEELQSSNSSTTTVLQQHNIQHDAQQLGRNNKSAAAPLPRTLTTNWIHQSAIGDEVAEKNKKIQLDLQRAEGRTRGQQGRASGRKKKLNQNASIGTREGTRKGAPKNTTTARTAASGFYQLEKAQVANVDQKVAKAASSGDLKLKGVAQVQVEPSRGPQSDLTPAQLSARLHSELGQKQKAKQKGRAKGKDGEESDNLANLEEFARIDDQAICDAIGCSFETGSLCEWEPSVDELNPQDPRYKRYMMTRKLLLNRHRRDAAAAKEEKVDGRKAEGKKDGKRTQRSWHNWVGRYRNRLTGIARSEVFSTRNQRFAASYVRPGQRSTLTGRLLSAENATIRFRAWEATRDLQLRMCCDDTQRAEQCVFQTEAGVRRGSRKWQEHQATCPAGTKKVIFECLNLGQFQGACGLDNIQLVNEYCPSVTPLRETGN